MIPPYQRKYSWNHAAAHSLIRDIAEIATQPDENEHWTGVIIYREIVKNQQKCPAGRNDPNHICREIIDGQQRLTTILIWIRALVDHSLQEDQEPQLTYDTNNLYLQHPNDSQFKSIVSREDVSRKQDLISKNYMYFRYLLWHGQSALIEPDALEIPKRRKKDESITDFWSRWIESIAGSEDFVSRSARPDCGQLLQLTVRNLSFLGIKIGDEEPEKVFSALNGNRTELTQFDHLRNFVFSTIDVEHRDSLFEASWKPAEATLEDLTTSNGLSIEILKAKFLYDYLISLGEGNFGKFNQSQSFTSFKKFYRSPRFLSMGYVSLGDWVERSFEIESKLWSVQREHYLLHQLAPGVPLNLTAKSRRTIQRIRLVSDGPPAPIIQWILRRSILDSGDPRHLSHTEVEELLAKLEALLYKTRLGGASLTNFRSAVISSMGKIDRDSVATLTKPTTHALSEFLKDQSKVFWRDLRHELENEHKRLDDSERGVYQRLGSRATLGILDAIDESNAGSDSRGFLTRSFAFAEDDFWVEHIFPISWNSHWRKTLGAAGIPSTEMTSRLHVLGNLTALPKEVNKDISNKAFSVKTVRVAEDTSAKATPLQRWVNLSSWDPDEIDMRTHEMVEALARLWPD